jgi:hypothetical protein
MKVQVWSKTRMGKSAAVLTLIFIAVMALKLTMLRIMIIPLPTPLIALLGIIGFILGVIAIIKNKDRALLTLLSIPIGLFIIFWIIAEFTFPH